MDSGMDDGGGVEHVNSSTVAKWFRQVIAEADAEPENLDMDALLDKARTYVEQMVGPRRPDETTGAHRARAFAGLLAACEERTDAARNGDEAALYAGAAADAGHVDVARGWYERLVVDSGGKRADHWLLLGAFSTRCGRPDEALACARTAVAVDGRHRVALFAHAATLIATAAVEHCDELEPSLERLGSAHPRFAEGHVLAALHWRRMEMPDLTARSLSLAHRRYAQHSAPEWPLATAWWRPDDRSFDTDAVVRCATLLAALELVELAASCLRCFGRPDAYPYHYLMAVLHHKRGEYDASAEHLRRVDASSLDDVTDGRLSLLAAHNLHGRGCHSAAADVYAELAVRRPAREHFALAYTRLAEHHVAEGRHADAAHVFHLACRAAKTPELLTSLAACLVALRRDAEAEKLLAEAVAEDGADNADAWHQLAAINAAEGWVDVAEVCRRQADRPSSE